MRTILCLVLGAMLLGNPAVHAARDKESSRELGGHLFVPLESVAWPFITTHFGFQVGGGLLQQNGTGIDESGNPTSESLNLAALAQGFNLGVGLFDWVALRAHFSGFMIAGASLPELLGVGASFNYSVGGGAVVRIYRNKRFRLAGGADFSYGQGKLISPGLALATALQTASLDEAKNNLLVDISSWSVEPVIAAAVAPFSLLGVQTSVSFAIGNQEVKGQSELGKALGWGLGLTLDLQPVHVPLAFPVGYRLGVALGDTTATEHDIEAGLVYSGRANLDLGVSFSTKVGSEESKRYLGALRMNYIW